MSFIAQSLSMFSTSGTPLTVSTLLSSYASLYGSVMIARSAIDQFVPDFVRSFIESKFRYFFITPTNTSLTIIVDEHIGVGRNEVFDAAEIYLRKKINDDTTRFKVGKTAKQKSLDVSIEMGEEILDSFEDFHVKWRFVMTEPKPNSYVGEKRLFEVEFDKRYKDRVMEDYLPLVLAKYKEMKEGEKVVRLYTMDCPHSDDDYGYGGNSSWGSIALDHPSTFDTLAMEPEMKKAVIEDLERFVGRKEYYKKVGKAWKRGYLLYGPPGTGKSSLIAAMANYLKFDIFDLELSSLYNNSALRRILLTTTNKSILVIEDIDCSVEMHDRESPDAMEYRESNPYAKLTLSGLLNFIDGLWSSVGDERIIIFTTNHKDRLDPALLRPGRMDMHIHMSYCTYAGFRLLALNYLGVSEDDAHQLFDVIKGLMEEVEVTPAQMAEELMKSENVDVALQGVVDFLIRKKDEAIKKAKQLKKKRNGVTTQKEEEKEETEVEEEPEKRRVKKPDRVRRPQRRLAMKVSRRRKTSNVD